MMKAVPKYILKNIERTNRLIAKATELNMELEGWLERNGVENGYDFMEDCRMDGLAYAIIPLGSFVNKVRDEL